VKAFPGSGTRPSPAFIVELDSLKVSGDVEFKANVVLKGTVKVEAPAGDKVVVAEGPSLRDRRGTEGAAGAARVPGLACLLAPVYPFMRIDK